VGKPNKRTGLALFSGVVIVGEGAETEWIAVASRAMSGAVD
jgi:hypothetical protein